MSSTPTAEELAFGAEWEQAAADSFIDHLWPDAHASKRGEKSQIDMAAIAPRGQLVGLMEVKMRRVNSDAFDSTIVHWLKFVSAKALGKAFNVRTACIVVFNDKAGYFYLDERPDEKKFIVRGDRGEGCNHAVYNHSRITWLDGLREAIERQKDWLEAQKEAK